jgi:uncharacterized protein (TIGR02594 family)
MEGLHERRDRDKVKEYLRTGGVGMDPATTAWCAAFVNSSLAQEGIKGSGSQVATSFMNWGQPATGAIQRGDVLVKNRGHRPGEAGGHVGMATGKTRQGPNGLEYEMISGNSADQVRRTWEPAGSVIPRRAITHPEAAAGTQPASAAASAPQRFLGWGEEPAEEFGPPKPPTFAEQWSPTAEIPGQSFGERLETAGSENQGNVEDRRADPEDAYLHMKALNQIAVHPLRRDLGLERFDLELESNKLHRVAPSQLTKDIGLEDLQKNKKDKE